MSGIKDSGKCYNGISDEIKIIDDDASLPASSGKEIVFNLLFIVSKYAEISE